MRTLVAALWLVLLAGLPAQTLWSQTTSSTQHPDSAPASQASEAAAPAPAPAPAKIDPAKEADIRRMLEVTGVQTVAIEMMNQMMESIKPLMVNSLPPGDYRDKLIDLFLEKFRSKADAQRLVDLAVPVYDKHFSHDEIKALTQFYQTPLGKKTLTELPQVMLELQTKGQAWGENLGRDSMQEVLTEHPDLAEALATAAKSAQH
jgi:hypothetical protein